MKNKIYTIILDGNENFNLFVDGLNKRNEKIVAQSIDSKSAPPRLIVTTVKEEKSNYKNLFKGNLLLEDIRRGSIPNVFGAAGIKKDDK